MVEPKGTGVPSENLSRMRLLKFILLILILAGGPLRGWSAEPANAGALPSEQMAKSAAGQEELEHGLTSYAVPLWDPKVPIIGHFPITNSMLVTWIVAIGIIAFAQIATRNMKAVPEGAQNFWEWMVESLYSF